MGGDVQEQKLLLSTASQTERQGPVNYPYATDPKWSSCKPHPLVGGAFDISLEIFQSAVVRVRG